jgi:hypothetical protein
MFGKKITSLYLWYMRLPLGKKVIFTSFVLWLLQAIPKWGFVLLGDGEMPANIMRLFITPRSEQ